MYKEIELTKKADREMEEMEHMERMTQYNKRTHRENYEESIPLYFLFEKYQMDTHRLMNKLYYYNFDFISYPKVTIEFRGDGMGILMIDNSKKFVNDYDSWINSLNQYLYEDIKGVKVNLHSWVEYRWCEKELTEKEIIKMIYDDLLPIQ